MACPLPCLWEDRDTSMQEVPFGACREGQQSACLFRMYGKLPLPEP